MESTNTLQGEGMKFILNGRSFDTAASTVVAISRGVHDPYNSGFDERGSAEEVRFEYMLYRTAKGAFFVHEHQTAKFTKGKPVVTDKAFEFAPPEALAWITNRGAASVDGTGLDLPDEA